SKCVIAAEMTPDCILKEIERGQATHTFIGSPSLIEVLDHPNVAKYDLSSVSFIVLGGAPLSSEIFKRAIRVFGNVFGAVFGLAECGPITGLRPDELVVEGSPEEMKRLQSCGREAINADVRIVDDQGNDLPSRELGEVIVKGDCVMKEYLKAPQATEQAIRGGWLYTGDMATRDKDGYIYVQGRKKDMITTSGRTVVASEIEDVLYEQPSVKEAAVVGVPDEDLGQAIKAVIVLREGEELSEGTVIELCKKSLPDFAIPKFVEFVTALPKSTVGKILKHKLG
ncbi:MAG: AMP-binding protein, partial [Pseudomonadota bacterium]